VSKDNPTPTELARAVELIGLSHLGWTKQAILDYTEWNLHQFSLYQQIAWRQQSVKPENVSIEPEAEPGEGATHHFRMRPGRQVLESPHFWQQVDLVNVVMENLGYRLKSAMLDTEDNEAENRQVRKMLAMVRIVLEDMSEIRNKRHGDETPA
jgi:hypothetical protein